MDFKPEDVEVGDRIYFTEPPFDGGQHYLVERVDGPRVYAVWVNANGQHSMPDPLMWSVIASYGPYLRKAKGQPLERTAIEWDELLRRKTHEALASVFTDD